jgi:hypothetical protein
MNLRQHLRELETKLLDPAVRQDQEAVSQLLAEEFREFGSSGRTYTKAEILNTLEQEISREIVTVDFTVQLLSATAALVTYRAQRAGTAIEPSRESLRSSIWIECNGRWQMLFHQGTAVRQS